MFGLSRYLLSPHRIFWDVGRWEASPGDQIDLRGFAWIKERVRGSAVRCADIKSENELPRGAVIGCTGHGEKVTMSTNSRIPRHTFLSRSVHYTCCWVGGLQPRRSQLLIRTWIIFGTRGCSSHGSDLLTFSFFFASTEVDRACQGIIFSLMVDRLSG